MLALTQATQTVQHGHGMSAQQRAQHIVRTSPSAIGSQTATFG